MSECFYSRYIYICCMWRDEEFADGRKKDEDGLIKC